jgi:thiol:disulfide interchange protein DsbD
LEEITFHNADVVQQARQHFVMVKVDVTKGGNPLHERLLKQYGIQGVPTIVFLEAQGNERKNLRLVDFLPPEQFLGRMADLKKTIQQ